MQPLETLNGINQRLSSIDLKIEARFDQVDAQFVKIIRKFNWAIGLICWCWITTILTILYHR